MKRMIAVLLALALVLSFAACSGAAEPAPAPKADTAEETAAPAPAVPETVAPTAAPTEPVSRFPTFTEDEAEEYYQALMGGQATGPMADYLKSQDEYTAKLYLDCLTNVFHDDLLGGISSCSGREMDMIMAEVVYMANEFLAADAQDDAPQEEYYGEPGNTLTLYSFDLDRSVRVQINEDAAFVEPDWAMMTNSDINYFRHMDSNYEIFSLQYGKLTASTQQLIDGWMRRYESQGIDATVSDVETFTAGGYTWEMLTISYEQTTTGIDKDTNKEVTLTSTVYSPTCFARLDGESALQLNTDVSVNPDILEYYANVICSSIRSIEAEKLSADMGVG